MKKLIGAIFFVQILVIGGWMVYFAPPVPQMAMANTAQGSPEATVKSYYQLAAKGDYQGAYAMLSTASQASIAEQELQQYFDQMTGAGIVLSDVFPAGVDGNLAVQPFVLKNSAGQIQLQLGLLEKEGSNWTMELSGNNYGMEKIQTILELAVETEKKMSAILNSGQYQGESDSQQLLMQVMTMLQSHSQALEAMKAPAPPSGKPNDSVHGGGQAPDDAVHGGGGNGEAQTPNDSTNGGDANGQAEMPDDAVHSQAQQGN